MQSQEKLTHLLIELYEKLSSWEHCVVKGKGLTLPQLHTLEILGIHGPLRMKELAGKMGVTTGTLTVLADRLESKNLVRRTPNTKDRRSYLVELTDKGAHHFTEHDKLHGQLTKEITSAMTRDEIAALAEGLEKINKAF
jgi:DNA-binding MarR family transcriptional regulator